MGSRARMGHGSRNVDRATLTALTEINRRFYSTHGREFSEKRHAPWRGWQRVNARLEEHLPRGKRPRILDVGCGNGRFLRFLAERCPRPLEYHGVDFEIPPEHERRRPLHLDRATVHWHAHDFVLEPHPLPNEASGTFDCVALFGVMHHVPSFAERKRLLAALGRLLADGSVLALTLWQFGAHARFRNRILPWSRCETLTGTKLTEGAVEPGDCLLAWGMDRKSARYCHHVTPEEWHELLSHSGLRVIDEFSADGETNDLNDYKVLTRD